MKITRNILDNGKKIVHITYSKEDIENAKINIEKIIKDKITLKDKVETIDS